MAPSGVWKLAEIDQIPPNMSVSSTRLTLRGQKLSLNAILKSKMATYGFRKTVANDQIPPNMGISGIVMMH